MACPALQDLAELLVGERVSDEVRSHVTGCAACTKRLAMLRNTTLAPSGEAGSAPTEVENVATAQTQTPDGGPPVRPSIRLLHRGEPIGRYVVSELLGAGGMGVVYAAYDPQLDRRVAVKILRAGFARNIVGAKQLLLDEAKAMAKLSHHNVVTVHDVGVHGDQVFLAMELVEGQTFRELLRSSGVEIRELRRALLDAGRGLAAAHKAGLVHRDFKPENVLIGRDGRVCVSDFGIARSAEGSTGEDVAGTPMYMAPEAHDGVIDPRSDQYSFCLTMLEAYSGKPPTLEPSAQLESVPLRVRRVLSRGLAADPAQRFPTMESLLAELAPKRKRRVWLAAGAGALIAGAAATIAIVARPEPAICASAASEVASTWSGDTGSAIAAAFAADKSLGASVTRAIAELDAWRGRWITEHTRVCRATRVDGTQSVELLDLRMECLRGRASAVGAIAAQLRAGDRAALAFAGTSVVQAGDLARCSGDRDALRSLAVLRDPVRAQHADQLRGELSDVEAKHLSGRSRSLVPQAEELAQRADKLGVPLVSAPARFFEGAALAQVGDKTGAAKQLRNAILDADRAGDDELRVRAQTTLAQLLSVMGDASGADELLAAADATIGRLGRRPEHMAALAGQRGKVLFARGLYPEALALAREALDGFEQAGRGLQPPALSARVDIGMALEAMGKRPEARASYETAIAAIEQRLGNDAPNAVAAMTYLASLEMQEGHPDAARALLERGIGILDAALGADAVQTTVSRGMLATLYAQAGETERARGMVNQAFGLLIEPGPTAERGALLTNLADIETSAGNLPAAIEAYDKAMVQFEGRFGVDHPALVEYLSRRADVKRQAKQYDAAKADLDRAMIITTEKGLGEADQVDYFLAQNAADAGKLDEARAGYERCAGAGAKASQPMMTALCEFEVAKLMPPRERANALRLAKHARAVFAEAGDAETTADIDAWLARR